MSDRTVREAIDELRAIRSTDPCALHAVAAMKAAVHTLEQHWIGGRRDDGPDPVGVARLP